MAAVTFQLVSVQENLHQTTALYADTNDTNTPLNAAPRSARQLSLSRGKPPKGSKLARTSSRIRLRQTVLFVAETGVFTGNNGAATGTG